MRTVPALTVALVLFACRAAEPAPEELERADGAASRAFRFHYEAYVDPPAEGRVDLWIPIPVDTPEQRITDVRIEASHDYAIRDIESGGGRSLHATSDFEPIEVRASWLVERREAGGGAGAGTDELARALAPDARVPLDGKVARVAADLPGGATPVEAARVLYDHTLARMRYDKPDGEGWGRGDAEWACESRFGNCTDFHSYFIGLARTKGLPARFEMGFSVPPAEALADGPVEVPGYHCWAWFWGAEAGWVPVDVSEADKHPERAEYLFGHLDADRFTITRGRDLELDPPTSEPLNFFVYPWVEIDGVPTSAGVTRRFTVTAD